MDSLTSAIIGHMVGDYLLQSDSMAQNKKKSSWWCLAHCLTWASCVWAFSLFGWAPMLFLFICHFAQDRSQFIRWYMSLFQKGFAQPPLGPWSVIVVDNTWHLVQIWIAWRWLQ